MTSTPIPPPLAEAFLRLSVRDPAWRDASRETCARHSPPWRPQTGHGSRLWGSPARPAGLVHQPQGADGLPADWTGPDMRRAVAAVDADQPVLKAATMDEVVDSRLAGISFGGDPRHLLKRHAPISLVRRQAGHQRVDAGEGEDQRDATHRHQPGTCPRRGGRLV